MNKAENSCHGKDCCTPNKAISCTVCECMYHCNGENYCSLENVKITTHEKNPTECRCVDCSSFAPKN